jgi:hypothetical protein
MVGRRQRRTAQAEALAALVQGLAHGVRAGAPVPVPWSSGGRSDVQAMVLADRRVSCEEVMRVVDAVRRAGVHKLGFASSRAGGRHEV